MRVKALQKKFGPPSKYKPNMPKRIYDYIEDCETNFRDNPEKVNLPSHAGIALLFKVSKKTLGVWMNERDNEGNLKKPEFSQAMNALNNTTEKMLMDNGLTGDFKPATTIFALKNYCDMTDKTETTQNIRVDTRSVNITIDMSQEEAADAYKRLVGNFR